jgi:hypothetical protein
MDFFHHIFSKTPAFLAGVFLLLVNCKIATAQNVVNGGEGVQGSVKIFDADGKLFINPYIDVAGSPFFLDDWKFGKLKVADNSLYSGIRLKLDILNQQVHFLKADNIEMVAPVGMIREITLFDSSKIIPVIYFFQCGFPAVDNQDGKNFYRVISDGKIKLLESVRKSIHQDKNEYEGTVQKEFRQYEEYYFFSDNKMYRIKKDKKFILGLMTPNEAKIENYITQNNLSYKSIDDIKKIVDYYNSL